MNQIIKELESLSNGGTIKTLYAYGVGIDTHRDFIAVCVLLHNQDKIKQYEMDFSTSWTTLNKAREWIVKTITEKSKPQITPEPLRYTIESTSTYHLPVLRAFGGKPSVVNPLLAGSTRRKTDKLDARLLAYQSLTGLWNESFVISNEIHEFRLLIKERVNAQRQASSISQKINNYILRFGHTLGSTGSVRDKTQRSIIEDMCHNKLVYDEAIKHIPQMEYICPDGLPDEAKPIILSFYSQFDELQEHMKFYENRAMEFAKNIFWETEKGYVIGKDLIKNLTTIPYVGDFTVLIWLSEIVTPLRFQTAKHVSAYCGCDPSLKVSAGKVTSQTRRKGNANLHKALTTSAGSCINMHKEPFGQWGYQMCKRYQKGGYKKACGAVARRLATALYHCNLRNESFTYKKYNFFKCEVPDLNCSDIALSNRVEKLLLSNGVLGTLQMKDLYISGALSKYKGFGTKALNEIDAWIRDNDITKIKNKKESAENGEQ